ncbi:MAG: hypothetical protein K2X08_07405 [Chlamydiales bacterium]|nr:hypothetical protein [Chlamydiales bacterium]
MASSVEAGHLLYSRECEIESSKEFREVDIKCVGGLLEGASKHADVFSSSKEANAYMRAMCKVANEGLVMLSQMPVTHFATLDRSFYFGEIAVRMLEAGKTFEREQAIVKNQTRAIEEQMSSEFPPLTNLE